jgi:epsilon-lactone hydrolase
MAQSLLTRFYRLFLRWFYRPFIGPPFPVSFQRRFMALAVRTAPGAAGVEIEPVGGADPKMLRVGAGGGDAAGRRALLWVHGGGFVLGSPRTHAGLAGHIARAAGDDVDVYLPDYRLAPEHAFPAATDDIFRAYRTVLARGYDPQRVAIGGDSAGGAISILTALAISEMDVPSPAALVLISPVTDLSLSGGSVVAKRGTEAVLREDWLRYGYRSFADALALTDPSISPLYADPHGLPPTLIQVGEHEVLLDDSLRWADRAWGAGVDVELQRFPGMWHDFQIQAGFIDVAAEAVGDIGAFLRRRWA